jgi:DNA-binding GntR family transcriptional regulator
VREALENRAAFLAAPQVIAEELTRVHGLFEALRGQPEDAAPETMETAGDALHELILKSARNERLSGILMTIKDQLDCIGRFTVRIPGRVRQSYQEHLAILDALEKRDPHLAEQATRAHLESTKESVLHSLL